MAKPIELPADRDPTNKELGQALTQTHECLNDLRKQLSPVILASKFIIWAGPIVVAAIIGGLVQTYTTTVATHAQAQQANDAAKVSAAQSTTVVRKLNSLGAAP